ncbi:sodium:proton antiporter [Acetobacteraceae bacterium KSS8]|uniref:Sodium:proton antiporter n=1 Tax=Endosaccharibacter trunci TaxID=2812733 RepID=A0ABT1WAA9_9PROT|nr:sodium:proton antiporter [Acetobacteraceae bacterium KSS8]
MTVQHADAASLGVFLFVACVVSILARRVGLPYAVGLAAAGIGLGLTGFRSHLHLTPELIFAVLLPPLIFEAALQLGWRPFRREAPLVLNLAFVGTLLSTAVVSAGMHWLVGWGWQAALLFGSLIAATDPVSVIAMMKEQKAEARLHFVMESESLVNDGAAAVLFSLCVAAINGEALSAGSIGLSLVTTVGGGVLCGLVIAGVLLLLLIRQADDPLVEITVTALTAYGSFLFAETIGVSPVLATLAAGMLVHNWGRRHHLTEIGSESVTRFWEFAAFLANSVIFLLIGTRTAAQPFVAYWGPAVLGIILALLGRAVAIYSLSPLYDRTRLAIGLPVRNILFWGGLRGALAAALALASPEQLPEHDAIIGTTFAVVAFSIFAQGLTVPRLLRRSGLLAGGK